jgi:hypothetical protein
MMICERRRVKGIETYLALKMFSAFVSHLTHAAGVAALPGSRRPE